MKKYVTKFETAAAADNYVISDIPFTTSIATNPIQNLVCNRNGKKLVNVAGVVEIQTDLPTMVDLGLSSGNLWAATNVGAVPGSTPESYYGFYFAWGEKETKSDYSWNNYAFGVSSPLSKYDEDSKIVLEGVDDIATDLYGSEYAMPTIAEIQELIDGTDQEQVTNYNGITNLNGCKFMKKSDHLVFIFIPAAGSISDTTVMGVGSASFIWSSSLDTNNNYNAQELNVMGSYAMTFSGDRCLGQSVRAIQRV